MTPLQEQFVAEARELIQEATDDLIALESEGFRADRIDRVFRAFHTLKGSAAVVDLAAMSLTVHAAEDLLAAIQREHLELTPDVIDRTLACLDLVSQWVDDFASRGSLPSHAGDAAVTMKEQLRGLLSSPASWPDDTPAPGTGKAAQAEIAPWVSRLIEAARERKSVDAMGDAQVAAVSYEPRADCFFNGDDPLATMRKVPHLLAFHIEAREPWPTVAEIDPYSCNLRLQCLTAANRPTLADIFRLMPDQVRIVDVLAAALSAESDETKTAHPFEFARSIIEEQVRMLRSDAPIESIAGRAGSAARVACNVLRHGAQQSLTGSIERAGAAAISANDLEPLLTALEKTLLVLAGPQTGGGQPQTVEARVPSAEPAAARRSLRVEEGKIDALANVADELIVLKNAIAHLAKRINDQLPGQDLARAARHESDTMERLSSELHAAVLELRMVPVVHIFRSFPRLVRDMAQRLDKKVRLITEGETTEADKTIVDRLFEPLMHLVRNALDHGIESPERRRSAAKPEVATVTLRASRAGHRFIVEVSDDGGGIDPKIVRRRAIDRGVVSADGATAMSEEQVVDLIFSPGFSTAAQLSDISGRGVGMDVVRTTVNQMDGHASVTSAIGIGTTVRLDLPANIAMSRVMIVEVSGEAFGVPMDAVTETIRLTPDRISQIKNNEGFVLRKRVVPIFALAEAMKLPVRPTADAATRLFIVTETGGKVAAIEIDAVRDRLDVVLKPMRGLLSGARGYAGTALLGDGRVLLVLNLKELLP